MAKLEAVEYESFEQIKQTDENGIEFWFARDLSSVLNYTKWENFSKVIKRAMLACKNSGYSIDEQFPEVRKMFEAGQGAKRTKIDYKFTRYAVISLYKTATRAKRLLRSVKHTLLGSGNR